MKAEDLDPDQRHRFNDAAFEVFPATAAGILAWTRTTRPHPPREIVVAHARDLIDAGHLADRDRRALVAAGYHELDG